MMAGRRSIASTPAYDPVSLPWAESCPDRLWRQWTDTHGSMLIRSYLGERKFGLVLKTDAFDEAVADGTLPILDDAADRVVNIDRSGMVATLARRRYRDYEVAVGDLRQLPFPDASFDNVVSFSTLDHFDSREDIGVALDEIYRVLKPKGRLLLTMDNDTNPFVWIRNRLPYAALHRLGIVPYRVGRACSARWLRRASLERGFRDLVMSHTLHSPRFVAVRMARWLQERSSGGQHERFKRVLDAFEIMGRWPTRSVTGAYIVMRATK